MSEKKINLEAEKNADSLLLAVSNMHRRLEKIYEGGGPKRVEKLHAEGKMTARERINYLLDAGKPRLEIGTFAGYELYEEHGGCPAGGVVVVIGYVRGRQCIVVANDATVKAGAWFPITGKKNLRAQEIALENKLPIIYLVDSAGVYLPMQDEIFPDKEHFGRIFRNNARLSSMGIPQLAAIMGSCVAGGAYLPIMSDEALIVDGTGSREDRAAGGDLFGDELADDVGRCGLVREGGDDESGHAGTGAGCRTIQPPPTTVSPS
jgi:acetyl-CoA carboxylase carboxyltransferase component